METFWAKGYQATSMTDLTDAMGIASPSLYAAFGSKEKLFESALTHYCANHGGDMWERLDQGKSVIAAVDDFLMASVEAFTDSSHPPGCMVVNAANEVAATTDHAAWQFVQSLWRENHRQLAGRFAKAKKENEIDDTVDIDAMADVFQALQSGLSNAARMGRSKTELKNAAKIGCALIRSIARA